LGEDKKMMKTRYVLIIGIIISCFISAIESKEKQKQRWKGKIEEQDGVKIIRNPREPLYGKIKFDLEEDLNIGREDDENYIFDKIRDIQVDDMGNIYVLDVRSCRIQKYDKDGRYLQTIGRRGQGPGEFEMPSKVFVYEKTKSIYVSDMWRIKVFDKSARFSKDVILKTFPADYSIDDEGNIWAVFTRHEEEGKFKSFEKVNLNGDTLLNIARFPYDLYTKPTSETTAVSVVTGFEHNLLFSKIDEYSYVYGFSGKYELVVINKEGELLFKIRKDEPIHSFKAEEKSRRTAGILPDYKPFFYSIFVDDLKRIYLLKDKPSSESDKLYEYDVYNKEGYYIYKMIIPYVLPLIIRNGYLYTRVVLEEEGIEVVKRFKIKNWNSIKNQLGEINS
jgi:hypothetical protein